MTTDPNRPSASIPYATPVATRTPRWVWFLVGGIVVVVLMVLLAVAGAGMFYLAPSAPIGGAGGTSRVVLPSQPSTPTTAESDSH